MRPSRDRLDAGVMISQSTDGRPYEPYFTLRQSLARRAASRVAPSAGR